MAVTENLFIVHILFGLVIAGLSAFATFLTTHIKALGVPNKRSLHTKVIIKRGCIKIVGAFLVGILLIHFIGDEIPI